MTPDELIQLMRTCSMAQVRKELEALQKPKLKISYDILVAFYERASKRKP